MKLVAMLGISLLVAAGFAPASQETTERIAFQSNRDGGYEICARDPGASNRTRPTEYPATPISYAQASHPAWSPDGTKIAFGSTWNHGDAPENWEVWLMDSDGARSLTGSKQPCSLPAISDKCPNRRHVAS